MVEIRRAGWADRGDWLRLRFALWPDDDAAEHSEALEDMLRHPQDCAGFLALDDAGSACGFSEASLRRDYVNGCDTSPVLFLEGIHVEAAVRRRGIGRALSAAVAAWGAELGCSEFASDAPSGNVASRRFHAALGFSETEEVVFFRRMLAAP